MSNQNPQNIPNYPGDYYKYNNQSVPAIPNKAELNRMRDREIEKIVPQSKGRMWNSLQIRPEATFANQDTNEKIYILARRHWLSNVGWVTNNFIYILLPLILVFILNLVGIKIPEGLIANRVYLLILVAYYSIILTNVMRLFFDWFFDPYIVTNERILDFKFKPFSSYSVEEAALESIETVQQKTKGIIGALFNYGDVTISTEAYREAIVFEATGNPTRVRDIISDLAKIARTYSYGD